ncbi:MAG TPA: Dam family site-specific DNA-(adenine-N6)-methyltransferase [Chloroflexia bacterium]|nr:Dam family site-specific DNA-(adenine-N6)-methyltransferase [Chloroflexia bacterium]
MKIVVPPIKCQGIKTKLVPLIKRSVSLPVEGTWIEPFCGSCVVALNVQPARALLTDSNKHIIAFYLAIQSGRINAGLVKRFLECEGSKLAQGGEKHYKEVRARFNETQDPLDFLFLNRSCFNGVMRFNQRGKFNVPFCHKPERFSQAYITKIANQVEAVRQVVSLKQWRFEVADFRQTLSQAKGHDFVYVDPPYAGRHVDYFNSWNATDESDLVEMLKKLPTRFLLSTWHSNKYRSNSAISNSWTAPGFYVKTWEHFYHVGATEDLRNSMTEALIANYNFSEVADASEEKPQIPYALAEQLRFEM